MWGACYFKHILNNVISLELYELQKQENYEMYECFNEWEIDTIIDNI